MLFINHKLIFIVFVFIMSTASVISLDNNITIPLNKPITQADKQLYGDFIYLNRSSGIEINFSDVNKKIYFIIFQAHSHLYKIDVYKNFKTRQSYISGFNIGMYSSADPLLTDIYYIENSNKNIDLKLYISIHGYQETDPIPGGCNMEFPLPISPYIRPTYNKDYVLVDAAPARALVDPNCLKTDSIFYQFYMIYLPEMNFDTDTYFDGIINMMNLKSIRTKGKIVPETLWTTRRKVSAYPGVGEIYVAVARAGKSAYSIYVPAYTYACSPDIDGGCNLMNDSLTQFLCATLLFTGLFICYCGHRFFKTEMFLIGFMSGFLITYILISLITILDQAALIAASALSGVFFGAMWLMFWWLYGIPVLAVLLASLDVGFLFASIIYYRLPTFFLYPLSDLNFWSIFVLIMLLTALALVSLTYVANMVCCAVLGSYATVFSMDYYLGSNLKYILINTIRRAVVPNFNNAVLRPPFQVRDILLTLLWVIMAGTGLLFQMYHNKGRPPFPPRPRSIRPEAPAHIIHSESVNERLNSQPTVATPNERTPLLA